MKRSGGFTLVEVMIAITVFSLIMLGAMTAMRTLGRVNTSVSATVARSDEMRSVSQALRRLLEQVHVSGGSRPASGTWGSPLGAGGSSAYFEGDAREVTWLAPLMGVAGISGLHYLRLHVVRDALVLDIARHRRDQREPDWNEKVASPVLMTGVTGFEVAYRPAFDEPWAREHGMDEQEQGLQAVRIRLRAGDRYWPDLVVAPPALQEVSK